jgi:hypothetical protein
MEYCFDFFETCKNFCNEYINWFDVFIYFTAFIALYFALLLEYYDIYCPNEGQICKLGNGAAYAEGKPNKDDDVDTLLAKIRISSRYDEASVYWRRTIIFSILLMFTLLLLVLRRLPNGTELLISFITIYLFTFLFLVYYQEVVSKQATQQVNEATELLSH